MKRVLLPVVLTVLAASVAPGQEMKHPAGDEKPAIYSSAEVTWKAGPAFLAAGAKFAVLEGDPAKEGPFVMRIWLPNGFRVQPHWHPTREHVTVISGTFNLGMGEKFDRSVTGKMPAGTFGFWPAGMRHFAWAKGDTVIQIHGVGPRMITYVNPADDPRNAKK